MEATALDASIDERVKQIGFLAKRYAQEIKDAVSDGEYMMLEDRGRNLGNAHGCTKEEGILRIIIAKEIKTRDYEGNFAEPLGPFPVSGIRSLSHAVG